MSSTSLVLRRLRTAAAGGQRKFSRADRMSVTLGDGARTTLHVASYERRAVHARVVALKPPAQLVRWCAENGVRDAVVGGFFSRPAYVPLGLVRVDGEDVPSLPFDSPWGDIRACLQILDGKPRVARRHALGAEPAGDVLQAGPLLVAAGRRVVADGEDVEGFSAGAHQFDSDITRGRYPRAALAISDDHVLAVACDGRGPRDAGMTLPELAEALLKLGVTDAMNLDGGGSASLVFDGRLLNRPREQHGADVLDGRSIATAIVLQAL